MRFLFADFVNTVLSAGVTPTQTTISVSSAANIPTTSTDNPLALVLMSADQSLFEVVYCTFVSGTTLTVMRGQEGTAAQSWNSGDNVFAAFTAGVLTRMLQRVTNQQTLSANTVLSSASSGQTIFTSGAITLTLPSPTEAGINDLIRANTGGAVTVTTGVIPPGAATLGSVAGGSLAATTYYVKTTFTTAEGQETLPSAEQSIAVAADDLLTVVNASATGTTAATWSVYVGTTAGGETLQASGLTLGATWTEPTGGITTTGNAVPTSQGGLIILPDGSTQTSYTIAAGSGGMFAESDGTNYHAQTFGPTIVSPATALNQAVSLTQIRPVYNVFQFGATGNGSTDDTAAIQTALKAAGGANGGVVYLPVGTYNVSATLTIPTNVTLEGVGKAQDITAPTTPSSVLVWTSTATGTPPVIELGPNTANSCVKNLAIRSTNAMVANGILVNSTRQFLVSQVSMDQVNVAFDMEALSTTNCSEGVIEDIYIYRCNVGMYFEGDTATPTYVTNNVIRNFAVFSAAQSGISLANNCDSNTFFRVEIAEAAGVTSGFNGILAGVSGSADVNRIYFYAVTVSGSNGYAISMSDSSVSFFGVELAGSYNHASIYIAATAFPLHLSESTGNTVPRSIAGTSAGSIKWFESFSNGVHSVTAVFSGYENDTTTNQTIGFDWPFGVGVAITSNNTGLTLAVSGGGLTITTPDSTATYNGVVTISGF